MKNLIELAAQGGFAICPLPSVSLALVKNKTLTGERIGKKPSGHDALEFQQGVDSATLEKRTRWNDVNLFLRARQSFLDTLFSDH